MLYICRNMSVKNLPFYGNFFRHEQKFNSTFLFGWSFFCLLFFFFSSLLCIGDVLDIIPILSNFPFSQQNARNIVFRGNRKKNCSMMQHSTFRQLDNRQFRIFAAAQFNFPSETKNETEFIIFWSNMLKTECGRRTKNLILFT